MKITATVHNYWSKDNVDFMVNIYNTTTNAEFKFFAQPKVTDNEVTGIHTPDSKDDMAIIDPCYYDETIEAMQAALDEYNKANSEMQHYIVKREYREAWNSFNDIDNDAEWIVTEVEIDRLANEWGKDKAELLRQVEEA